MLGLASWVLLLLPSLGAEAKVQYRTVRIGPSPGNGRSNTKPWHYVGKYGFTTGQSGTWGLRAQLVQIGAGPSHNLTMETYLDEDWPQVEEQKDVCQRNKLAKRTRGLRVGPRGEWGPWINGSVQQKVRPHMWYFTVSVCNSSEVFERSYKVKIQFRATQPDGSEFSYEQRWMPTANFLVLVGQSVFLFVFFTRVWTLSLNDGVHPVIWTLTAVLILQYLAQFLHTGHLMRYRWNGEGFQALEVLSEIMFIMSQVCQTCLLILIALGYTLLQSGLGELDLLIPLYMIVGVAHILVVVVAKLQDEASHHYHEYEGALGWVLLVIRLILFTWFIWATHSTAAEGGFRLRSFMRRFTFAGSLYFLAYPGLFMVVDLFAPYLRAPVMASGQMIMQMASQVWLSFLFLNRGEYFKVSTLSTSLLPGGSPVNSIRYKEE